MRLDPADARVSVDGRSLARVGGGALPRFSVAQDAPSSAATAPGARFELELEPGFHTFSVESKGFARGTIQRSFPAGANSEPTLSLSRLPAVLSIRADRPDAIVQINRVDVGPAPVDVQRPPGALSMSATLVEERPRLTKTWWFWSGIGAFLASSALIYYAAQPTPAPPPYDGGSSR